MTFFKFILLIISFFQIKAIYSKEVIVVSDIDDTLKFSAIAAGKTMILKQSLDTSAFYGINFLYQFFNSKTLENSLTRKEIFYVSGAPGPIREFGLNFLRTNLFPLKSREHYLNKRIGQNTKDFKIKAINSLIQKNPDAFFVLVGDNGEYDPDVYHEIEKRYPERTISFIHTVYTQNSTNGIDVSYTDTRNKFQIYASQIPYYTGADLALEFYKLSLITRDNLRYILDESIKKLKIPYNFGYYSYDTVSYKNNERDHSHLFHRKWMNYCNIFFSSEWNKKITEQIKIDYELNEKIQLDFTKNSTIRWLSIDIILTI